MMALLKIRVLPTLWLQRAIGEIQFYQVRFQGRGLVASSPDLE